MKKTFAWFLALVMLFTCAFSTLALAEETSVTVESDEATEAKAEEAAEVMKWLAENITEADAAEILSWDRDTILAKLDGYDQPLEYNTKEELADELVSVLSLLSFFTSMAQSQTTTEGDENSENGEGSLDLSGLFSGMFSGSSEEGAEGGFDLSGLLGGMLSGGAEGTEGSFDLSGLFGGLLGGGEFTVEDGSEEEGYEDEGYEIYEIFNGTIWQSGEKQLESVFQDGYYKVAITEGDTELSYLCEFDEYEENGEFYQRLTGIGTGVEELDAEQADAGKGTFVVFGDELTWTQPDGTATVFTQVIDPLTQSSWYVDGKTLNIEWFGGVSYGVTIGEVEEGCQWIYDVILENGTFLGTGHKEQYGEAVYTDANVTLTFSNGQEDLTWVDDKEEATAEGITFERVNGAFVDRDWFGEGVNIVYGSFIDGNYLMNVQKDGELYSYYCTYDRDSATLTALDPATLDMEMFGEPEGLKTTGSFTLQDEDHLLWIDDTGAAGEAGIVLVHED